MKDAQDASLVGKQGPWQQYPKRMMQIRARAFALRDTFTLELKGIRMAEEERDITPEANASPQSAPSGGQQSTGTASRVGDKLAQRRQKTQQRRQAHEDYEADGAEQPLNCAQVCEQIKQATTMAELNEASDLAQQLPEDDKCVARDAYEVRRSQIRQTAQ